jgi:hypothetical protein
MLFLCGSATAICSSISATRTAQLKAASSLERTAELLAPSVPALSNGRGKRVRCVGDIDHVSMPVPEARTSGTDVDTTGNSIGIFKGLSKHARGMSRM